jgi:hypothetical protein
MGANLQVLPYSGPIVQSAVLTDYPEIMINFAGQKISRGITISSQK